MTRDARPALLAGAAALTAIIALAGPVAVGSSPAPADGTIAYLSADRRSIHLIAPDGSGDRVAWATPEGTVDGIQDVAWSPDGSHLAISSGHEALCSVYQYDLYTLRPDGTDMARVTNAPDCAGLAGRLTGSVSVKVDNLRTDLSQFFVYVAGAPAAQLVTIQPGFEATVVFPAVADLGAGVPQSVVAGNADSRWFSAGVSADVVAGGSVEAGTLSLDANAITTFGALTATWSADGSTLGYQFGQAALWQVGADPAAGSVERPLLDVSQGTSVLGNDPAWSPVADQVLYERFDTDPWTVSLADVGGDAGREIVTVRLVHGISWLPDGSAFVVSASDSLLGSADLYLVDVATSAATALTAEGDAFAYWPSVSPDGKHIAYTRIEGSPSAPTRVELRTMGIDGSSDEVIATDAIQPSWGPASLP